MTKRQKTAVIDFDNTLAGYDKWRGEDCMGPPIPYAVDAVNELIEWGWHVVVFTTRGNKRNVRAWLEKNGFQSDRMLINSIAHNPPGSSGKPIAEVYFDDRDCHVVGTVPYNWHRAMRRVRRKYRPRLDTHFDDAQEWGVGILTRIAAWLERRRFVETLQLAMIEHEIVTSEMSEEDKNATLLELYQ